MNIFDLAKTAKDVASNWIEADLIRTAAGTSFEQGFVLGYKGISDGLFEQNNLHSAAQAGTSETYAAQLGYFAGQEFRQSDRTQSA
jgi:hypothetical protein